jgi:hypothetical protein
MCNLMCFSRSDQPWYFSQSPGVDVLINGFKLETPTVEVNLTFTDNERYFFAFTPSLLPC